MEEKIIWCARIKTGIRVTLPDEHESKSYLDRAISDLKLLKEKKVPENWIPTISYYCAYYSIYSILRAVGIKSENHSCSIEVFKLILDIIGEKEKRVIKIIEKLKKKREESQYYLKKVKVNVKDVEEVILFVKTHKAKILLAKERIRKVIKKLIESVNE